MIPNNQNKTRPRILVICGPTATGKSDLAVQLAKRFDGEIISADSRQVYRGLDIGTGKITNDEMQGVPHHLLDIADPGEQFTVARWKDVAEKTMEDILSKGRLPIVCGGTGYYIDSLLRDISFPDVENDPSEQATLENKSAIELLSELQRLDPRRANSMKTNGESSNKRRLIRAILVARKLGFVPEISRSQADSVSKYDTMKIGILIPDIELKTRIRDRLISRIESGMIEEAKSLHDNGLKYDRMNDLGLENRYQAEYLQGHLNKQEMIDILATKIWQYARRQKTWFRRDKDIHWIGRDEAEKAVQLIKNWLS